MFKTLLNLGGAGGLGAILSSCEQVQNNAPGSESWVLILLVVIMAVANGGDIGELIKKFLPADKADDKA